MTLSTKKSQLKINQNVRTANFFDATFNNSLLELVFAIGIATKFDSKPVVLNTSATNEKFIPIRENSRGIAWNLQIEIITPIHKALLFVFLSTILSGISDNRPFHNLFCEHHLPRYETLAREIKN